MSEVKRYRAGDFVPVQAVAASCYDAAKSELAAAKSRESALREELQNQRDHGDEREAEMAALREELAEWKARCGRRVADIGIVVNDKLDLQQRLTAAEQRNVANRGLLHRALNVIRGMRYDELEASIVEALNIKPTESGASE